MGTDKALVQFGEGLLVNYVLEQVAGWGDETLVISNNADFPDVGVRVEADVLQGVGALGGLHAALFHARNDAVMLLAVDMPFIHRPLMFHLLDLAKEHDAVIPRWREEDPAEPFRAVYRRGCLDAVAAAIEKGERRMISFFPDVRVRLVAPEEVAAFDARGWTFTNTNTPEELAAAEGLRVEFESLRNDWPGIK